MSISAIAIIASILSIVATIFAFVYIIPANKREGLNKLGKFLHDTLNFKTLWIEKICKFFYVVSTAFTLVIGFLMLFWVEEIYHYGSYYYNDYYITKQWMGYYGLLVIILGPVLIRIVYEGLMMAILACKNIMDINNKLSDNPAKPSKPAQVSEEVEETYTDTDTDTEVYEAPAAPQPEPERTYQPDLTKISF